MVDGAYSDPDNRFYVLHEILNLLNMKELKRICIYHSVDLDGWTSAAIVKNKFPDVELVGWCYGDEIPLDKMKEADVIIMVDISFSAEIMLQFPEVIWIDHHKSAIEDSLAREYAGVMGHRDTEFAACELTWMYFYNAPMPEAIRLLGRYDCFGHKGTSEEKKVLYFQYYARSIVNSPEGAEVFLHMNASSIAHCIQHGCSIHQYLCMEAKAAYASGFPGKFDGKPFIIISKERFNPINFGIDYAKDGYVGAACFWYNNGIWTWSLYSDDGVTDVSEIAKARGGGGHFGASGFRSDKLEAWDNEGRLERSRNR